MATSAELTAAAIARPHGPRTSWFLAAPDGRVAIVKGCSYDVAKRTAAERLGCASSDLVLRSRRG